MGILLLAGHVPVIAPPPRHFSAVTGQIPISAAMQYGRAIAVHSSDNISHSHLSFICQYTNYISEPVEFTHIAARHCWRRLSCLLGARDIDTLATTPSHFDDGSLLLRVE